MTSDDPGDEPTSAEDGTDDVPPREEQTKRAKDLSRQRRGTRAEVDHDDDTEVHRPEQSSSLSGLDAFHAIARIAPFLALVRLYADEFYPRKRSARSRFDAFTADHKVVVRIAMLLDFLLRLVLVVIIVAVVLKGVSPLPNPFKGGGW